MNRFLARIACLCLLVTGVGCLLLTGGGLWLLQSGQILSGALCMLTALGMAFHVFLAWRQDKTV